MSGSRIRRLLPAIAAVLLVAGPLVAMHPALAAPERGMSAETPDHVLVVSVQPNSDHRLWPWTSRRTAFDTRTLPINVVVREDARYVRYLLAQSENATWNVTEAPPANEPPTENATATGAAGRNETLNGTVNATNSTNVSIPATEPTGDGTNATTNTTTSDANGTNDTDVTGTVTNGTAVPVNGTNATNATNLSVNATNVTFDQSNATNATNATAENESTPPKSWRYDHDGVVFDGTSIRWKPAEGSTRYTYVHNTSSTRGTWLDETYQLHDGSYLGARYHLRLYAGASGDDAWTAIQAHHEHWDWFRLRHTVGSTASARHYVEREFQGGWYLSDMKRVYFGNGGALDADGWVTEIDIEDRGLRPPSPRESTTQVIPLVVAFGAITALTRDAASKALELLGEQRNDPSVELRHIALFASLAVVMLVVRIGSVTVEQSVVGLSPKVIAAAFYPLLVLGTPLLATFLARGLPAEHAFVTAVVGFGAGVLADYAYLHISMLPIEVILHRVELLVAVGLFAAAGSRQAATGRRWNWWLALAVVLWVGGLAAPLLGWWY